MSVKVCLRFELYRAIDFTFRLAAFFLLNEYDLAMGWRMVASLEVARWRTLLNGI